MSDQTIPTLTNYYFAEHAKDIEKVLQCAVNHALLMHKRLGNRIATWRDGKVVIVRPKKSSSRLNSPNVNCQRFNLGTLTPQSTWSKYLLMSP